MNEYELNKLINNKDLLDSKIKNFLEQKILVYNDTVLFEIKGHAIKANHNLHFVKENISLGFFDWAITGCYYACYHAALALILTKGYFSKNHFATLCVLINEFYGDFGVDIRTFYELLDYQDVLFYVESKQRREDATYSSSLLFHKNDVELLFLKAELFVKKAEALLSHNI